MNVLRCSSPSCAATLRLGVILSQLAMMRRAGWRLEQQPGDDRPMPYCKRCRS